MNGLARDVEPLAAFPFAGARGSASATWCRAAFLVPALLLIACGGDDDAPSGRRVRCEGIVVDLDTNEANCGACGNQCPSGSLCTLGRCDSCEGPAPRICCGGENVNPSTDVRHCGGCDHACADGETCLGGICAGGPPGGFVPPDGG